MSVISFVVCMIRCVCWWCRGSSPVITCYHELLCFPLFILSNNVITSSFRKNLRHHKNLKDGKQHILWTVMFNCCRKQKLLGWIMG